MKTITRYRQCGRRTGKRPGTAMNKTVPGQGERGCRCQKLMICRYISCMEFQQTPAKGYDCRKNKGQEWVVKKRNSRPVFQGRERKCFVVPPRFVVSLRKRPSKVRQKICIYFIAITGEPVAAYGKTRSVRDSETMFNEEIHIPFQQPGLSVMVCGVYSSHHCLCGIDLYNLCLIINIFCRIVKGCCQKF